MSKLADKYNIYIDEEWFFYGQRLLMIKIWYRGYETQYRNCFSKYVRNFRLSKPGYARLNIKSSCNSLI